MHRSALSPDGKNVLLAEMDDEWWRRCRVVPFDGASGGGQSDLRVLHVGPVVSRREMDVLHRRYSDRTVFTSGASVFLMALLNS